ncbi:MAG: sel1 repeat family protein, partial [Planctomycetota bacterium]
ATALTEFRLLAQQGNASAQSNLGFMYSEGQGVLQDYVQAHMWVNLAAVQGKESYWESRDKLAERMTPAQIAEAQQLAREWKAKQ